MKHQNLKIVDLCLPLDESILEIQISLCEGGVIAVLPDDEVIPLLGENKKATLSDKGEE